MTRFRALVLASVSAGLGAVATGGLRLVDSRSSMLGLLGSVTVLGAALVVDALRPAAVPAGGASREVQELREEVRRLREHVTELEVTATLAKSSADSTARISGANRSGSWPAL